MADYNQFKELEESMATLKTKVASEVSTPKLAATYARVIDGFVQFCRCQTDEPSRHTEVIAQYYESVTKVKAFCRPNTEYLKRLSRPILMIRDTLDGKVPALKYNYNVSPVPNTFADDIHCYENWLIENNYSKGTVQTRIGRIKQFFIDIQTNGCESLEMLNPDILVGFIGRLNGRYSSAGKSNILYTVRHYLSCPLIKQRLAFEPISFLENLHTNKHERLESCYTTDEIRKVFNAVDRSAAKGKMDYLMMLLAGLYGLRSCDIRMIKISNINWKRRLIVLNQHKTGRYLELPLIEEVLLAMLDYIKNARPTTSNPHIFIRQRSPHIPYSDNNHFASRIAGYFEKAEVTTTNKHTGLHSMRHSLATALLKDNVSINDIADILGHSSPQSTTKYIWSDIEHLRNAASEVNPYVN